MTKAERTYLDWNATAPLLPAAREAFVAALDMVGNPSSVHGEGRALRMLVEAARRDVAALVKTAPAHVTFTSGATEAANLALTPNYRMGRTPLTVGHLYASEIEHPAIREGGRFAREAVTTIPVTRAGIVDLAALETLLQARDTAKGLPMVAVMLANNETGIVQPVKAAAEIVRQHGGLLVVDAVQAVGRIEVDIEALDADFLIVSSHKLGGPKGAGALISRGEVLMPASLIRGGGQEKGHRSGTENPAALAGFAAAARVAAADLAERNGRVAGLRDAMEAGMRTATNDVIIHGAEIERIANTSFFSLPGLKSETWQIAFDLEGIALSAGSACSSGKVGQSHVLAAMGFDATLGGLRVSLGPASTAADVDRFLAAFSRVVSRRRMTGNAA